jgi:hypothetical protein
MSSEPVAEDLASDEIELRPTKQLFVEILTRDILLNRAILDLVDNSIDGARRLRPGANDSLDGLEISVDLDGQSFRIKDNCGGIGIHTAQHYAFRFGRPKGMPATPNSVGQFGVGMKRALFKFGRYFEIKSTSTTDRFTVALDVDAWENDEQQWRIKFADAETNLDIPVDQTGTDILVTKLRESVSTNFALERFRNGVAREVQAAQQVYIDRGLRIVFDKRTLIATPWRLLQGSGIEPAKHEFVISQDEAQIVVRIFAGLGPSTPQEAGWYIFCNGRMIVEADQSSLTGWQSIAGSADVTIPKFHNQFSRFRGYVFFDSENASVLPWDTTKTGVDFDSSVYQSTLLKMIDTMRPIIDFLNEIDAENDLEDTKDKIQTAAIARAALVSIRTVQREGGFAQPPKSMTRAPAVGRIAFSRPREKIDELKAALAVTYDKNVGEKSFDLAYSKYVEG